MGKKDKGTKIQDLPDNDDNDDNDELDSKRLELLNSILDIDEKKPSYKLLINVFYATILFAILSLPFIDRLFELAMPITTSWLIMLGFKIGLFFILFYIASSINNK